MAAITRIAYESDCSGCPQGLSLDLRRDGSATRTMTGKARLGTSDRVEQAQLPAGEFDTLARLLMAQRYFELAASYEDPELRDGSWATLTVVQAGQDKQVHRRDEAGPAALKTIEAAIQALQARLVFQP